MSSLEVLWGGAGTINGTVSVDGTLSPGETIGKLTVANSVILNTGSSFAVSLGGTQPGTEYDQLVITGASNGLSLDGSNDLTLALNSFPSSVGDQFTIADVQGTDPARLSGIFESLNGVTTDLSQGASFSLDNMIFRISYTAEGNIFENAGNNIMLEVVQVPEPSVVQVALLSGIGFAIVYGRRRDRNVPSISVA